MQLRKHLADYSIKVNVIFKCLLGIYHTLFYYHSYITLSSIYPTLNSSLCIFTENKIDL